VALAAATVIFSAALILWEIGSLPPREALAALLGLGRTPGGANVAFRAVLGFALVLGGTLAVLEAVPYPDPELVPISLLVFVSAILVEHLTGPQIRARIPMLFGRKERHHG